MAPVNKKRNAKENPTGAPRGDRIPPRNIILYPIIRPGVELSSLNFRILKPTILVDFNVQKEKIEAFRKLQHDMKTAEELEKKKRERIAKAIATRAANRAKKALAEPAALTPQRISIRKTKEKKRASTTNEGGPTKTKMAKKAKADSTTTNGMQLESADGQSSQLSLSDNQNVVASSSTEPDTSLIRNIRIEIPEDRDVLNINTETFREALEITGNTAAFKVLRPKISFNMRKEEERICKYAKEHKRTAPSFGVQAKVEVRPSSSGGYGLFAMQVIKKDTFIIEYEGEVVSSREYERRSQDVYKERINYYAFDLGNEFVIDGDAGGNEGRFINHSCDPNAQAYPGSEFRIVIFSTKRISIGEEITINYRFTKPIPCQCNEENCNGIICEIHRD